MFGHLLSRERTGWEDCKCAEKLAKIGDERRVRSAMVDGERCLLASRPDRVAWVIDHVVFLAAVVAWAVVAGVSGGILRWTCALIAAGIAAWFAGNFAAACCMRYVLTNRRVMRLSGVLRDDREYMTWSKVTDVSVERSFADRLTKTATIRIHSANEQSSFKALSDVLCPETFAHNIAAKVNERQRTPS
jgi:hypothetical protein